MADETDQKVGENDEKTTFKDLVSAKLKFFLLYFCKLFDSLVVVDVFVCYFPQGVTEVLCEACEKVGWKIPTKIQRECIPLALQGW
jgi:superfamily II DNA/RNA helicase